MVRSRHFEESGDEQIDIFDIKVCRFSLPYADWYTPKLRWHFEITFEVNKRIGTL